MTNSSFFNKDPIKKRLLPEFRGITIRKEFAGRPVQISNDSNSSLDISSSGSEKSRNISIANKSQGNLNITGKNESKDNNESKESCGDMSSMFDADSSVSILNGQNYGTYNILYRLSCEYHLLCRNIVKGVFVIPSEDDEKIWNGVIFLRNGIYSGATFRFRINIGKDMLDGVTPRVTFSKPGIPYHPLIDPITGELDVISEFPVWSGKRRMFHLVQYVRRIFYKIDIQTPRNLEAARFYTEDGGALMLKVRECIETSDRHLFKNNNDDECQSIKFSKMDENEYSKAQILLTDTMSELQKNKLSSWMKEDLSTKLNKFEDILKIGKESRNSITKVSTS